MLVLVIIVIISAITVLGRISKFNYTIQSQILKTTLNTHCPGNEYCQFEITNYVRDHIIRRVNHNLIAFFGMVSDFPNFMNTKIRKN